MENRSSIVGDKVQRATGPVHRPSESLTHAQQPSGASGIDSPPADTEGDESNNGPQPPKPPPYSSPSTASLDPRSRTTVPRYPGLPAIDFRQYSPPMFTLSADTTTISSKATYLSENAQALATLLRNLATVPPKPLIQVTGARGRRIDFSIKMNLMPLIIPDDPRERMDYLRTINTDEMGYRGGTQPSLKPDIGDGGLEGWCKRYIDDQSGIKTFTLERVVANLDTNWLEGQLRSLVSATEYKGVVTIQFPVTHAKVVIQNPDKVNKFFTSVSALFSGKSRYETVKAVWPFASAQNGVAERRCIVQSEKTWWEEWKDPIKFAIATKRHGWVTNEDKLECIMDSKGKGLSIVDWGPDY